MTDLDGFGHKQSIKPSGKLDRGQMTKILSRLTREWTYVMGRVKPENRPIVAAAAADLASKLAKPSTSIEGEGK